MNPSRRSRADSGSIATQGSRVARTAAVMAVAGFALMGCAANEPGSAAVIGDVTISQATIGEQMRALNEVLGHPTDTAAPVATRGLVTQGVQSELIRETAARFEISVPQSEVDQAYAAQLDSSGGEQELRTAAAQAFVPPGEIMNSLAAGLAFTALAEKLAPAGSDGQISEVAQAAVVAEVVKVGDELDVSVAPRYGEWSPEQLQIVPQVDPVSKPEAPPGNPLGQLAPPQ